MKKKIIIISVILVLCAGLLILTNIYELLLLPLDIGQEIPEKYGDVILIQGGGLRPRVVIGYSTEERLNRAIDLYREKPRNIILSDGSLYIGSPAILKIRQYLLGHQIDNAHIFFEGQSQTTFESCQRALDMIKKHGFKGVIVCTSPYHQKRTRMILKYLGYQDFRMARMIVSEVYRARTIRQRIRNIRLIFREYVAILKFLVLKK
jgi:uncharacterized SAM-binding protein YcdF (DUF218 family)